MNKQDGDRSKWNGSRELQQQVYKAAQFSQYAIFDNFFSSLFADRFCRRWEADLVS